MGQDCGVRLAFESGLIYVVLYDCVEGLGSGSGTPGQPTLPHRKAPIAGGQASGWITTHAVPSPLAQTLYYGFNPHFYQQPV